MPSRRRHSRSPSRGRAREKKPEILQHLGRAVLSYSLSRLAKNATSSSSSSKKPSRSRSRRRSRSGERSPPARDNSDLHRHMTQLAAGVLAFGVKQYMAHRREKKKKEKQKPAASQPPPQDRGLLHPGRRGDAELAGALASLTAELQGTSEAIRRLARQPPSHRNCEVYRGLVENADRIQAQLENLQASANNMRNLHPGLAKGREEGRRREGPKASSRGPPPRDAVRGAPREVERGIPRGRWRGEEEGGRRDGGWRPREPVAREPSRFGGQDPRPRGGWRD
ncbi:hypothetical protein B0H67DRAFT_686896 [Lasiosphaeris hirsuta]|uniref:Uncharacterized protein n=1 Tax=Lasiosphaeris hirsuta TaxID=260670 RepID=A0AA39ZVL5_9PEZI|nr:hypothetical protein B0H67DRAFT_686896 [Lasiosphaeris hirsuta]